MKWGWSHSTEIQILARALEKRKKKGSEEYWSPVEEKHLTLGLGWGRDSAAVGGVACTTPNAAPIFILLRPVIFARQLVFWFL